jgi:TonB family protein
MPQVVETAPGNDKRPEDSKLAAESDNTVQKQTIAKDRKAGEPITAPRHSDGKSETTKPALPSTGAAITDARPEEPKKVSPELGRKAEIPTTQRKDELALRDDPHGGMAQHDATKEQKGNSDRLRLQVGNGDGDARAPTVQGAPGAQNRYNLTPSAEQLDKIAGGPAPDMVDNVEKGDSTFLNTREWRYASFFNRVKQEVAAQWKPNDVLRRRDPSGAMFLFKDRYTLLGVKLKEDGRLADVWVERSSGVDFLDEEAITAFQKAEPFPNPPHGLVDDRGEIQFAFGFFLETDHGGLQIFRRN